ncbi:MAG: hypothetical protein FH747_13935 [Stenotrophomonas sp.]|uniref:hypothetical protein n=1 Tax=Stenotrophomonas sp. TaxID=69392 RepID=UPI0013557424|nr:hypothetical protein [Stenotrophomonas sp.]MTI74735.1 hypothetical protein [Stenotrophomonas sp.]
MARIHTYPAPGVPVNPLVLIPALEGGGSDGSRAIPLFAARNVPSGQVLKLRRPMIADLTTTADADPGAGKLRWNHAVPTSATMLYIDDMDNDAVPADLSAALTALDVGGFIYVQGLADGDRDNWQQWQVTSITAAAGYTKVGVSLQASNGTFIDASAIEVSIQKASPMPGVDRNVVSALAVSSGNVALDCSLGDYFKLAPTANVTGWTITNVPPACSLMIELTQDSTAHTIAWPSSFKWAGGAPGAVSTGAGTTDLLAMTTFDGGASWRVTLAKAFT